MSTLRTILVKLGIDTSDYDTGLDKAEGKAKKSGDNIGKSLSSAGKTMALAGGALSLAVTTPIVAATKGIISAASDYGESVNAVTVVFGEGAAAILKYGETAAKTAGLSSTEFNKMATTTGAFLQNVGFDADAAGKETIKLTERAADMASVFNTDVATAMAAIQSGLKGEFNPLEQFGVKLNAAAIEARALEMGLADTSGELTDTMKSTAALALIYEQTAKTQGDFVNTSGGLANSMRILKGQLSGVAVQFGTILLPVMLKAVGVVSQVLAWFSKLSPTGKTVIMVIAGIAAVIGPLLVGLGSLFGAIGAITTFLAGPAAAAIGGVIAAAAPIIGIILAIVAVIAALYLAWQNNFLGIRDITASVIAAVVGFWQGTLLPALQAVWGWLSTVLFPFFQAFGQFLSAVFGLAVTALAGLWQNILLPAFQAVGGFLSATLGPIFQAIGAYLSGTFGPIVSGIAGFVGGALVGAFNAVSGAIQAAASWLKNLAAAIKNLKLPDWLTPGSPTPFELGLVGIGDALKALSTAQLPKFDAALDLKTPGGIVGTAATGKGGNTTVNNTYNIFSKEQPGQVRNALTLSQLMGGAA